MTPLFILYGGEIVLFLIALRIGLWIVRSGGLRRPGDSDPGGPPGPRGTPRPAPQDPGALAPVLPLAQAAVKAPSAAPPGRRAA